jgi:integrase/recombinase XerD
LSEPKKGLCLPTIITGEGQRASKRFLEFFTANIRNPNTRLSYMRAINPFLAWCEERGLELGEVEPMIVAAYIERLTQERAPQTVKQHLAAIRMLFDWLVIGQVVPFNPAASVRGPRYSIKKGKTPVLSAADARRL